jgi:hypothetical protein
MGARPDLRRRSGRRKIDGRATWPGDEPPPSPDGHVRELASHPGHALSGIDGENLGIVPLDRAARFVVTGERLRDVGSGRCIALGAPSQEGPPRLSRLKGVAARQGSPRPSVPLLPHSL